MTFFFSVGLLYESGEILQSRKALIGIPSHFLLSLLLLDAIELGIGRVVIQQGADRPIVDVTSCDDEYFVVGFGQAPKVRDVVVVLDQFGNGGFGLGKVPSTVSFQEGGTSRLE